MFRVVRAGIPIFVLSSLLGGAAPAWAQDAGLTGVVTDTSGAVLPGVTVTATSPVLIEKERIAVTDAEGRYAITQLRPGDYNVSFSLSGFSTVRREGIRLTAGFTASVEAELRVGALEETITVTGSSPVVDVANVRRQTVVTNELLEALPTSTKSIGQLTTLTTGVTGLGDVGGTYQVEPGQDVVSGGGRFHGKGGTKVSYDGMGMENSSGNNSYQLNAASVEEMVMSTSGISADTNADGIVVNIVPKEGGNTFRTILAGTFANSTMEATNLSQELKDRGLLTANKTIKLFDESVSVGGPIKRDRLWFFVAPRTWGVARTQAGTFWNKTQNEFLTPPGADYKVVRWTPWVDRPEDRSSGRLEWYDSVLTRITWQATEKNKFNFTYDEQRACNCGSVSAGQSHEYYLSSYRFQPNRLLQVTWNAPITSRLLLEAGTAATISQWNMFYQPGVREDIVSINDVGLGIAYGSAVVYLGHPNSRDRYTQRASLSYVTGSHNFKTGFQNELPITSTLYHTNGNRNYIFFNGSPLFITQWATPYIATSKTKYDLGLYAQDQWKVTNQLTVNLGLRWDGFNGYTPEQQANAPGQTDDWPDDITDRNAWLAPRTLARVENIPNWKDWSPRMGVSYDLFGNGRTALKAQLGRYISKLGTDLTEALNPIGTSVTAVTRSWTDRDRDFVPDCDLGNFEINDECGAISNRNFGQNNPNATRWDPAVLEGYGKRDANWDFSTEIQHELRPGFGVTGGYYWNNGGYTRQGNAANPSRQRVTDNLLVGPQDYDTYCITAPLHPKLPDGGGYPVCGLAHIKADMFGRVQNLVTLREPFGEFESRNDFFNVAFDARLPHGVRLGGGMDTGRTVADNCFVVDSPQDLLHCRVVTPFSAQTQFKAHGVFPLPAGFVTSFAYQNLSGPAISATYTASAAEIVPSLGRPLSGGATSVQNIPLVAPQTLFEERVVRLDMRLAKSISIQRFRIQVNLDAYNILNANSVRAVTTAFGANWTRPTQILDPRIFQIGGQITF